MIFLSNRIFSSFEKEIWDQNVPFVVVLPLWNRTFSFPIYFSLLISRNEIIRQACFFKSISKNSKIHFGVEVLCQSETYLLQNDRWLSQITAKMDKGILTIQHTILFFRIVANIYYELFLDSVINIAMYYFYP